MKMKKIVLLFSMIAVLFSMTGCSDGQEKVDFEYTQINIIADTLYQSYVYQNVNDAYRAYLADSESEVDAAILNGINNFDTVIEECGEFVAYRSKEGDSIEFDFAAYSANLQAATAAQDQQAYLATLAEYSEFAAQIDATVEEDGNTVVVKVTAEHEKRDAVYTYIYEENSAHAYSDVAAYQVKEITAFPNYSMGEKMEKAAYNTLMGMGTVFLVLIFIAFIIGQFERLAKIITSISDKIGNFINKIKNRKKNEVSEEVSNEETVTAPVTPVVTNPMEDTQLVAVITAAVVAANTSVGGTDKLVVRSIRKARR